MRFNPRVDERIILKWILLSDGVGGRGLDLCDLLWGPLAGCWEQWTVWSHIMPGISWLAKHYVGFLRRALPRGVSLVDHFCSQFPPVTNSKCMIVVTWNYITDHGYMPQYFSVTNRFLDISAGSIKEILLGYFTKLYKNWGYVALIVIYFYHRHRNCFVLYTSDKWTEFFKINYSKV
jgi:hypothetical protein